jgi:hypothetical protein
LETLVIASVSSINTLLKILLDERNVEEPLPWQQHESIKNLNFNISKCGKYL